MFLNPSKGMNYREQVLTCLRLRSLWWEGKLLLHIGQTIVIYGPPTNWPKTSILKCLVIVFKTQSRTKLLSL